MIDAIAIFITSVVIVTPLWFIVNWLMPFDYPATSYLFALLGCVAGLVVRQFVISKKEKPRDQDTASV
jgi:hypothetical protein